MLEALFRGRTLQVAGFAAAIVLALLAHLLLPLEEKRRARLPFVYAAVAVIFDIVGLFVHVEDDGGRVVAFLQTLFVLASIGKSVVLLGLDVMLSRRTHRVPPRIFRDLWQAVVYVIVVLLTLRAVGVEPGSILTTSALLTAVIGLALQDTLGNLVSGLAIQMQRPFEVGDWIQFDPDPRQIGKVTEVNWRATTLRTNDLIEVIVPNGVLAKAAIRNFSRPSSVSRRIITVLAPYGVPPKRVHEAIASAIVGVKGVLTEPKVEVITKSFDDNGMTQEIHYFTDDYASRERIDAEVRDRVWYGLQRASIEVPYPTRTMHVHQASEENAARAHMRELERRDQVLRCVDFLDVLPFEAHRKLAEAAVVRLYAPGEMVVSQGAASSELFVIDRGEVSIELPRPGGAPVAVARLGARKFFGEMGLMTGEPRTASVRAETECELLVIGHEAFHDALAAQGDVVEKMSDLLSSRQAELEAAASSPVPQDEPVQERSRRLISQIRSFFKL